MSSIAGYFDTTTSTLNPNNVGPPHSFFVYGTVPVFLGFVVLAVLARRREGRLIGRHLQLYGSTGWLAEGEVVMLASLLLLALGTSVFFAARNMPGYATLMNSQVGQTIVVRARDGTQIVAMGPSYGEWLHADEIPQVMKDAMVAVEDRRYYTHFGIDPIGLVRALYVALRDDSPVRATSTISQQLARNVFLNSNRTIDRKLREAVLAMALEWKFSKEQILELYLNKIYLGNRAYGVGAAAQVYYGRPVNELTLAEIAMIAGLPKAPSAYNPLVNPDRALARRSYVLRRMQQLGFISDAEYAMAATAPFEAA